MVSNLAAVGIVPDFGGCYEDQMLRASATENDLYAIRSAGERIAVIHWGFRSLDTLKCAVIAGLRRLGDLARRLPYDG